MGTAKPKPLLHHWACPPETTSPLDWAPLVVIDLSKFEAPEGKAVLADEIRETIRTWGFWVVTGHGIDQGRIDRQFSIANTFFKQPIEEKRKVPCDFSIGNYFGYHEPTRLMGNTDVKENLEFLCLPKYTESCSEFPRHDFISAFEDEISSFQREVWEKVVVKMMKLFAIILELPEDYFVERHRFEAASEDHLRYMLYHPHTAEENEKIEGRWLQGHTDIGSLTLLFRQNIAALQVLTPDNEWKWVKPIDGGIVCNAADTLSFMSKGYVKSAIHRVVKPPPDQVNLDRLGLFYFTRPANEVPIVVAPSPVLRREGILTDEDERKSKEGAVTAYEYVRARARRIHDRKTTRVGENTNETMFKVKNLAVRDQYL